MHTVRWLLATDRFRRRTCYLCEDSHIYRQHMASSSGFFFFRKRKLFFNLSLYQNQMLKRIARLADVCGTARENKGNEFQFVVQHAEHAVGWVAVIFCLLSIYNAILVSIRTLSSPILYSTINKKAIIENLFIKRMPPYCRIPIYHTSIYLSAGCFIIPLSYSFWFSSFSSSFRFFFYFCEK